MTKLQTLWIEQIDTEIFQIRPKVYLLIVDKHTQFLLKECFEKWKVSVNSWKFHLYNAEIALCVDARTMYISVAMYHQRHPPPPPTAQLCLWV